MRISIEVSGLEMELLRDYMTDESVPYGSLLDVFGKRILAAVEEQGRGVAEDYRPPSHCTCAAAPNATCSVHGDF